MKTDEHKHNTDDKIMELLITHNRVIFGSEIEGDMGIKKKIDEVHTLLTQARNVSGFFGGLGGAIKWLIIIASAITLAKGLFGLGGHLIEETINIQK